MVDGHIAGREGEREREGTWRKAERAKGGDRVGMRPEGGREGWKGKKVGREIEGEARRKGVRADRGRGREGQGGREKGGTWREGHVVCEGERARNGEGRRKRGTEGRRDMEIGTEAERE